MSKLRRMVESAVVLLDEVLRREPMRAELSFSIEISFCELIFAHKPSK
jgi:hypothetical protein